MKELYIALAILITLYLLVVTPRILYNMGYDWCYHADGVWKIANDGMYSCYIKK